MFAMTNEKGMAFAFPDVCKTPAPPAPPIPLPYPNIAMMQDANVVTCAQKVFIKSAKAITLKTKITRTSGDEAGTLLGVVSSMIMGPAGFTQGSTQVFIEGAPAISLGAPTKQNGENANTVGTVLNPSQTVVYVGS